MRLRLHRDDNPEDEAPAPLPFPRDRAPGRSEDRRSARSPSVEDTANAADAALDNLQRGISELEELLDTLPFPVADRPDDGPYAA